MADFDVNVFRLRNERGYAAPTIHFEYLERDSDVRWFIDFGGSRLYLVRTASSLSKKPTDKIDDSHFMARRVTGALLMGGAGLFTAEASGRLHFTGIEGEVPWGQDIDRLEPLGDEIPEGVIDQTKDWFQALCTHTVLRRAIDDAQLTFLHPIEAVLFVYRGLEWIKRGLKLEWDDLAAPLGISKKDIRTFKRLANDESGARHASLSGKKFRGSILEDVGIVCGLIDGISFARSKLDTKYEPMSVKQTAATVLRALKPRAYE